MKIEKRSLIKSLDLVKRFIRKEAPSPIWLTVLVDGEHEKIVAINREGRAEISLGMSDVYKQINVPHEPEFPDESFFVDLLELDQDQLLKLCHDYGITYGTNPAPMEMVKEIWKASLIGADEESDTRLEWVYEKFCINPIKLGKIVRSLELRDKDLVDLRLESYQANNNLIDEEEFVPYIIQVGDHFSELPVKPSSDFPVPLYLDMTLSFVRIAEFAGKELLHICNASLDLGDLPYQEIILFDTDNDTVVSCDQRRVHSLSKPMSNLGSIKVQSHIVRQLARERKVEMLFDSQHNVVKFVSGNLSVMTEHVGQNFPKYEKQVNQTFQNTVTTDAVSLEKFVRQAQNLTGKHYRAIDLSFNDGQMSLSLTNPSAGKYLNENIDLTSGSVSPAEKFRVDAKFVEQALHPKSGVHSWVDISFDSNGQVVKFNQGDCMSLITTMR